MIRSSSLNNLQTSHICLMVNAHAGATLLTPQVVKSWNIIDKDTVDHGPMQLQPSSLRKYPSRRFLR